MYANICKCSKRRFLKEDLAPTSENGGVVNDPRYVQNALFSGKSLPGSHGSASVIWKYAIFEINLLTLNKWLCTNSWTYTIPFMHNEWQKFRYFRKFFMMFTNLSDNEKY